MRSLRTVRNRLALPLVVLAGLSLSAPPAGASVMRFLPIEELSQAASQVVRARITDVSVHWTPDREGIYTQVEAVVTGPVKGPAAAGRHITIIQAGGEIDGISLDWTGRPRFARGEDLVLFLQDYDPGDPSDGRLLVVGGKQGRMRVLEAPGSEIMVQRDLQGVLSAPFIEGDEPTGPAKRRDLIRFDELRRRVIESAGGPR